MSLVWKVGMRHQRDIKEVLYMLSFSCSQVSYVHIIIIQLLNIKQLDTDVPCIDCSLPTTSSNNSLNLPGIFDFCQNDLLLRLVYISGWHIMVG